MANVPQLSSSDASPVLPLQGFQRYNPILAQNAWVAAHSGSLNSAQQKDLGRSASLNPDLSALPSQLPSGLMLPQIWNNLIPPSKARDVISPDEEDYIIRALSAATLQGRNYNEALDSLNGVNNHSATTWKEYYLVHHRRFDDMVSRNIQEQGVSEKKEESPPDAPKQGKKASKSSSVKKIGLPLSTKAKKLPTGESSDVDYSDSHCEEGILDIDVPTSEDELNMGEPGGSYTDSDMRLLAKHIAANDLDSSLSSLAESFVEIYNGRSSSAWREYHRRRITDIDALVGRYRKKWSKSIQRQCGRPSWAKPPCRSPSSNRSRTINSSTSQEKRKKRKSQPKGAENSMQGMSWKDFT